jgi:hypothetical protein
MRTNPFSLAKACALTLALAAGARADLIRFFPSAADHEGRSSIWNAHPYIRHGWASHRPNRFASNACDLQALLNEYARGTHAPMPGKPGIGPLDLDYPHPAIADNETPGGQPDLPDPDEDESETDIAAWHDDARLPDPITPAVPEPGTMALMGAGALGLLAVRFPRRQ